MDLINDVPVIYNELKNTLSLGSLLYKTEYKAAFEASLNIELFFAIFDKNLHLHLEVGTPSSPTAFSRTKATHLFIKHDKDYYYCSIPEIKDFARNNRDKIALYTEKEKRYVIYRYEDIKQLLTKL